MPSVLYNFDLIEADDELEIELTKLYAKHREATKNKSERELQQYLQDRASLNKKEYHDVVCGLLYGVLTEPENGRLLFQSISFVNRDHFGNIIVKLQALAISKHFHSLKPAVRDQIFWLISELTSLNVQNVESLYICLLRQLQAGDMSVANLTLCDSILKLCEKHKSWLETNIKVTAYFVYAYLRVISDHRSSQLQVRQQREVRFVIMLLREKWLSCCDIGRDLIRVLHDLSLSVPEFTEFWEDLLNNPQKLSSRFQGIDTLLKTPTKKEYLRSRLTPDIEFRLLYILQNLRSNHYQQNLTWFVQRYLSTPESEPFYVDVVRYLIAGWYPSNQILQSDIVPRYVVIGSMIRAIKSANVIANVKTALIYDWLFFTPTDNIMFIEPAMLLMERSAERYPKITSTIMEYLKNSVDEYFPPLKSYMAQCVACGMRVLLSKGVIRSLIPVYKCPATEGSTKGNMLALFSEFLTDDPSTAALPIPSMPSNLQATPSTPNTPKTEVGYITEEEEGEERNVEEDDVDEYLYGESDTNTKTPKTNDMEEEDEDMEERPTTSRLSVAATETTEIGMDDVDSSVRGSSTAPRSVLGDDDNEQMDTGYDYEEEADSIDNNIQQNQSYWIFGDSLKRFKEASAAAISAQKRSDQDQYNNQLFTSKKCLKEILAVFSRMAIPAETLEPTIGPHVRNMVASIMLTINQKVELNQDALLNDSTKDLFDLIMTTYWNARENEALRDKMVRLISCISHTKKNKSRRHIIGMRWWSFIAVQLERDEGIETSEIDEWFPSILANYENYVLHAYTIEESVRDQTEYLKDYLKQDLHMLAEHSVPYFNDIIPLLYQYLPNATVGNLDILNLTIMMLLPDSMGKIVCNLHYGSMRIFGDELDVTTINDSFSLPTYETICFWQLLAAELQGNNNSVELLFNEPKILEILKTKFKNEIVSSLFSMLTSAKPSKDLVYSIIRIIPENSKVTDPQVQFALASFQFWSTHTAQVFSTSLTQLTKCFMNQLDNKEDVMEFARTYLFVLTSWWNQKLTSESFKNGKTLLSALYKLGEMIEGTCPIEWQQQDSRKKKRILVDDSDEE